MQKFFGMAVVLLCAAAIFTLCLLAGETAPVADTPPTPPCVNDGCQCPSGNCPPVGSLVTVRKVDRSRCRPILGGRVDVHKEKTVRVTPAISCSTCLPGRPSICPPILTCPQPPKLPVIERTVVRERNVFRRGGSVSGASVFSSQCRHARYSPMPRGR